MATFAEASREVVAAHRHAWRSAEHAHGREQASRGYAFPILGDRPRAAIGTAHVVDTIYPIGLAKDIARTSSCGNSHTLPRLGHPSGASRFRRGVAARTRVY